jgi:sugar transferase (PEP-CTERM system associated)
MIRLFSRYWSRAAALSLVVEASLLLGAVCAAYWLRFALYHGRTTNVVPADFGLHVLLRAGVFAGVVVLGLYYSGLYDFDRRHGPTQLLRKLSLSLVIAAVLLLAIYYVTYPTLTTGRGVLLSALAIGAALLIVWRLFLSWVLRRRAFSERVLIVGSDKGAIDLARELLERKHLGYQVVGFLDANPAVQGKSLINPKVIGSPSEVFALSRQHNIDRVVVAQLDTRGKLDMDQLLACKTSGISVEACSDYFERLTGKIMLANLRKSWLIFSDGFLVVPSTQAIKRLCDFVAALFGLVLTAPVLLLTAVAVRLDSPGPIFYRQQRVGLTGRLFTIWKFRSMCQGAEPAGVAQWAGENDVRITRVGRWLRKLRLDELPQLWNVLRGDMSLVGPRPERPEFVERLSEMSAFYPQRLVVRPGITGWAQIRAPYAATFEESLDKLSYDLYYVKNLSLALDASILMGTIRIVLFGRGAR